ncbi:hypothetical protein [Domibacillus tundrae]|uniref:hypothetical protein n=1 Tax=Domibacillus tundrae TaxID=1587527 RepID=UPI000617B8B3|nr:hypothetical protein [Domibacillus tundrae]
MAYIEFKATVKKVNLKPKNVKEIVLEVNGNGLNGKLDKLSEMIDQNVEISLESLLVLFNVEVDLSTNQPIKRYKVDEKGVVSELKEENKQIEADLGLPIIDRTKEEEKEIEREHVDQFILEGLAPEQEGFPKNFANYVKRRLEGESYSKMATELEISSGQIIDMMDEYRSKIAPLAQAWWDWKENSLEDDKEGDDVKPAAEGNEAPGQMEEEQAEAEQGAQEENDEQDGAA